MSRIRVTKWNYKQHEKQIKKDIKNFKGRSLLDLPRKLLKDYNFSKGLWVDEIVPLLSDKQYSIKKRRK